MIVRRSGESFYIESDQAKRLFTTNDLASVDLEVIHNCCSDQEVKTNFDLEFEDIRCTYTAVYCTFNSDSAICIKPQGTEVCIDDYYDKIRRVTLRVNGEDIAIVNNSAGYDVSSDDDMAALKAAIEQYFTDEAYKNITVTVTSEEVNDGEDYCVTIKIDGLPNGVLPISFVIGNDTPCYALPLFECIKEGAGTCVELEASISLDKDNKGIYPSFYRIYDLTIDDGGVDSKVLINTTFSYYVPTPTSVDFTSIEAFMKSKLVDAGYTADFELSIDADHNLIIKATNYDTEIKYISLSIPSPVEAFSIDNFSCSEYEQPVPTCDWTAEVARDLTGSDLTTVSTLFIYEEGLTAPTAVTSTAYDLSNSVQLQAFIDEANLWFDNEGYATAELSVTVTDSTITFTIDNLPDTYTPYSVYMADTVGDLIEFLFYCSNLDNVPDTFDYDPTKLEYRPGAIIVNPAYFGATVLADGIYSFKLTIKDKANIEYVENYCYFVDDEVKCNIIKALSKDPESNLHHYYESIHHVSDCNDCDCSKACDLYRYLLIYLNKILNGTQQMCRCYNC